MKKIFLIIVLNFLIFTNVNAQNEFDFGLKSGINFSNLSSEYFAENSSKIGIYIGLITEIPISTKFSIQPEILYSTQGADVKITQDGGPPPLTKYSLNYILVPILAKVYISNNWSVEVGPSFNFLIKDEAFRPDITEFIGDVIIQKKLIDADADSFELSGVINLSYKFNRNFFGSIRYFQGLTDSINNIDDARNNGFQLGVGYLF